MASNEQTGLEVQEGKADEMTTKYTFGGPGGIGAVGSTVLLERSDMNKQGSANKVTAGANQSQLRIAWLFYHDALVAHDNLLDANGVGLNDHKKHYREIPDPNDPKSGRFIREYFIIDYWAWMIPVLDDKVIEHQLTLWGYSREQFMRHWASISSVNPPDAGSGGGQGLFQQIKGLLK